MNGYTEKIYEELMLFTGDVKDGREVKGKRKLDEEGLIYLLGYFEKRIREIERKLRIKL